MLKLLVLLVLTPALSSAGVFERFAEQHNEERAMTVLTGEAYRYHKAWAKLLGPSYFQFGPPQWRGDIGLAPFVLAIAKPQGTYKGWMAFQLDQRGKVRSLIWTEGEQQRSWSPHDAELGQGADVATTALGLSRGFAEANPLLQGAGGPVVAVVKVAGTRYLKRRSLQSCMDTGPIAGAGWGAGALNAVTLATGALAPWAVVPAVAIGILATPDRQEMFWDCMAVFE